MVVRKDTSNTANVQRILSTTTVHILYPDVARPYTYSRINGEAYMCIIVLAKYSSVTIMLLYLPFG
jgi:hypothetical protein